jgi:homoserine O-acetyltransferase
MIGPALAIDTSRYFVLCVNSLGSCFGSTGPGVASIRPPANAIGWIFRRVAVEDIARAATRPRARSASSNWTSSWAPRSAACRWSRLRGLVSRTGARRLISISGSGAASPFAIALRSVQREAILRDPDWQGGHYAPEHPPRNGMRLARKLGTITYRSATEWRQRFGREPLAGNALRASPFAPRFAVEGYLEAQAERFTRVFDPTATCTCRARWTASIWPNTAVRTPRAGGGSKAERVLVIGVESDMLFRFMSRPRWPKLSNSPACPRNSRACPSRARLPSLDADPRATTPSWSTSRVSTPRSADIISSCLPTLS